VTAFARQADPAFVDVDQVRHPQTGSRAVNGNRFAFNRGRTAELNQMLWFKHWDSHGNRSEVVDNFKVREAEVFPHFGN